MVERIMNNKTILVTGGAGFIGSNLVDALIKKDYRVVVIDDLSTGKKVNINPKAEFHQFNICDFETIAPLFNGVDYVIHLAAMPRIPVSVKDPVGTSNVNITGTVSVFKASYDKKVKRVVFASSSSIYGNQKELPLKESMAPSPISPYGLQKLVGEQFAKLFTDFYKLPVVSLRFFNIYGPRLDPDSEYSLVIGKFLKQKSQGGALTIFGTGEQTRAFCFVEDLVDALINATESEKIKGGEAINIGNEKSYSVNYLADLIGQEKQYLPERPGDILHTGADITVARNLLDWEHKTSFKEGVKRTIEWFDNYKKNK